MLRPRMQVPRRLSRLALVVGILGATAWAPRDASAEDSAAPNVIAARRHYDKARADYEQGAYREAIAELDAAHALDPTAKDLVFNLGVVHEKLGDIEDALQWFRLYANMNLTPQEADRAGAYVRRLEGAKKELEQSKASPPMAPAAGAPSTPPAAAAPEPQPASHGRVDGLTIATAGIAAVGLLVGTTLAVKALSDQPPTGFVTGRDGTYTDLVNQTDQAHAEAVAADVAFGVGIAAGLACGYLYWMRPHATPAKVGGTSISASPLPGGAALVLRGTM